MKLKNTTQIVNDITISKEFYREILGLHVILDFGSHVILTSGICLQTIETWKDIVHKDDSEIIMLNHACELSFETEDIDIFMNKLKQYDVVFIHGLKESKWGQRVIRFYDPDGHIIEVGESLKKVAKRFLSQGLSHEEIAKMMGIPLNLVKKIING